MILNFVLSFSINTCRAQVYEKIKNLNTKFRIISEAIHFDICIYIYIYIFWQRN